MALSDERVDKILQKFTDTLDEPDQVFEEWVRAQPDASEIFQLFADILEANNQLAPYRDHRIKKPQPEPGHE